MERDGDEEDPQARTLRAIELERRARMALDGTAVLIDAATVRAQVMERLRRTRER